MIVLEESQLFEYRFSISPQPQYIRIVCKPGLSKIKGKLHEESEYEMVLMA